MNASSPHLELSRTLADARNRDGGWGYQKGRSSRLEPTCWALLALADAASPDVLRTWPVSDGLLAERFGGGPNYAFHALALLTLRALQVEHIAGTELLLRGIQAVSGVQTPAAKEIRQNNNLQGWSWLAGTVSWVEPTAWCLLALKRWETHYDPVIDRGRIEIAERLLLDRCCVGGGWNYGNSNIFGKELKPFVPTTAIALLALQDRPKENVVQQSLRFLESHCTLEKSGVALSLAALSLEAFKSSALLAVREAATAQIATTSALGNLTGAAMLLYALATRDTHGRRVF